ncbi:MAG: peptidoglycan DD-metalloendopeptidase family protein [Desulfarculus sp.]|nr:peptidoglycan DD-metalloendopeptidase family protein [Desulfarculus sp.]
MLAAKSTSLCFLLIGQAKTWFYLASRALTRPAPRPAGRWSQRRVSWFPLSEIASTFAALCLTLALGAAPLPAAAETPDDAARELRQRLDQVLDQREENQATLETLQRDLARLETEMVQAEDDSRDLARQEREIAARLPQVRQEVQELAPQVRRLREVQAAHLRALYLFGAEAGQSLLANAVDFHDVLTRSQAFTWLLEADQRRLEDLAGRARRLAELQSLLAYRQNEAQEVQHRLAEQRERYEALGQARRQAQAEVQKRQQALELNLASLQEAESRLARTFALAQDFSPRTAPRAAGILQAKGRLAPPVQGRLLAPPAPGQRGVLLEAPAGSPVRAPWDGTVVHASHLTGYGRVVVVDHGMRVHTVLAHLGHLSVEAGQAVKAGHTLGAVDANGRLYLEVRRESRPENPLEWLRLGP